MVDVPPAADAAPEAVPRRRIRVIGAVALIVVVLVLLIASAALADHNRGPAPVSAAIPVAAVVHPTHGDVAESASFEGTFRPFQQVDLCAQVAGFVRDMKVDIGDRVHRGQVLAVLEIPELVDDIDKAKADLDQATQGVDRAQAEAANLHAIAERMAAVVREDKSLLAPQDVEDAVAKDRAAQAALAAATSQRAAAQASLDRWLTTQRLCTMVAPFDGVITKRYADVGASVRGGLSPSAPAIPLVRLCQATPMRLAFPVPEDQAALVADGAPVTVSIQALHRTLQARVTRTSREINDEVRTLHVEVDVPNEDLSIIAGMYATVTLTTQIHRQTLSIPVQALLRSEGRSRVWVVDHDHRIQDREVEAGLEAPDRVEVVTGLAEDDEVFIGNRSLLKPGEQVEPRLVTGGDAAP